MENYKNTNKKSREASKSFYENNETISVIIPVYNAAVYLKRCLNSICCQTYKNLEIIVIDDGSTDDSLLICKEFQEKDSRIIFIHKDNEGVAVARNVGVDRATGFWISFVDSDDYLEPLFYEQLIDVSNKTDSSVISYEEPIIESEYGEHYSSDNILVKYECHEFSDKMPKYVTCVVWGKIIERELINSLRFYTVYGAFEDVAFMSELLYYNIGNGTISIINNVSNYHYYIGKTTSIMHTNSQMFVFHLGEYMLSKVKGNNVVGDSFMLKDAIVWFLHSRIYAELNKNKQIIKRINGSLKKCFELTNKKAYKSIIGKKKIFAYYLFYKMPVLYRMYRKMKG